MNDRIRQKLIKPRWWHPTEEEQQRLVMAMLKLGKDPKANFSVLWSTGKYGIVVSKGPLGDRRTVRWIEALELTNDAARRAEAAGKKAAMQQHGNRVSAGVGD